jgi:hypothetical protein
MALEKHEVDLKIRPTVLGVPVFIDDWLAKGKAYFINIREHPAHSYIIADCYQTVVDSLPELERLICFPNSVESKDEKFLRDCGIAYKPTPRVYEALELFGL